MLFRCASDPDPVLDPDPDPFGGPACGARVHDMERDMNLNRGEHGSTWEPNVHSHVRTRQALCLNHPGFYLHLHSLFAVFRGPHDSSMRMTAQRLCGVIGARIASAAVSGRYM